MLKNKKHINISKKTIASCLFLILITGAFLFFCQSASAAQTDQFGLNTAAQIGLPNQDLRVAVVQLVRLALTFVGIIALLVVMYAGFLWMTSAGNQDKIDRAKRTLVNAVIGLVLIFSAFLIVSFILNWMRSNPSGPSDGRNRTERTAGGIGALGTCAIESVYPEPSQNDVPRNTAIVVTFKEYVNPATIMDGGNRIIPASIKIFKTGSDPDDTTNLITNVSAATNDNKTFVFVPDEFLGSPSESVWYSVLLENTILNNVGPGRSIFDGCIDKFFEWAFEVNTTVDLVPPQVVENNVFPPLDNDQDDVNSSNPAVAATGQINVASQPFDYSPAALTGAVIPVGASPAAQVNVDPDCQQAGALTVAVQANGQTAQVSRGTILLGSAEFNGETATFPDLFSITVPGGVTAGNSWNFTITAERPADTLTVGNIVYTFVASDPGVNEILIGAVTVNNIRDAIEGNPSSNVSATVSGNTITVRADVAGTAGNNIALSATAGNRLTIIPMSGGTDGSQNITINGARDQPRNSIIQINFNEGMNPLTLSGGADALSNYLRVVNVDSGDNLAGKFVISNQYRTVEFIPDVVCGVNGCGEQIFCLPPNSHLRVEIIAANLFNCGSDADCAARTPYASCTGGNCANTSVNPNQNYPLSASPLTGAADLAMNSLDGNRDSNAQGPVNFYNENATSTNGDNYQWSFYISDRIDLAPPIITATVPDHALSNISLSDPVRINFDKLMMSDSLRTGSRVIDNGREETEHRLINIWNFASRAVGYWIVNNNVDSTSDGNMDYTQAEIRHALFADSTSYRSQVGSGVKDIYQNCFSPSAGTTCAADNTNRSCCPSGGNLNDVPGSVLNNGNCP